MYKDDIQNFPKQFEWEPQIENGGGLERFEKFTVLGMGGSHLAADVLTTWTPYAGRIIIHSDYGLPPLAEDDLKKALVIACSHSGNTEEVLSGFEEALEKNLAVAVVSSGGRLTELARQNQKPYILIPDAAIQPRLATGYHARAILKLMGEASALAETKELAQILKPQDLEEPGRVLAQKLAGRIPVIYGSTKKSPLAKIWKIKFNETAKVPAFYNMIPELNHNEMIGFDLGPSAKNLSDKFFFILLEDKYDHPQNQKRMAALADLWQNQGLPFEKITLQGLNHWHKIFSALLLADWTSFYLAEHYGQDPEKVPSVEEFKKKISAN